ncbi:MAG: Na/Pi cotransporter family protein [Lachnospiraceae bacterium]|nr:Na/Pi cotransporter family protein [Lachnospiraceae bacterium]
MTVFDFISLFGGLALFLYGMRIMGDGLKSQSTGTMKRVMGHMTGNPLLSFILGMLVTALIQSSTATIVLTAGLVSAGVLTLHQSLGIILGANVGTTITAQIIRLLDIDGGTSILRLFKPSTLAPIAAIVGILFIMVIKVKNAGTIGTIAMGFGILFTGLLNMTSAVAPLSSSESFANLFVTLGNQPILGFLAGAGVAFLIQSSSASVGILQALSVTGQLSLGSIYAILLGIYLGDCVTTSLVCGLSSSADSKRTGIVHVMFNIAGMLLIFVVLTILRAATGLLDNIWSSPITSGGIANTHTIFKLGTALLLLPVCGIFEKLSHRVIKDAPPSEKEARLSSQLALLDPALYSSCALALESARKTISTMADLSHDGVDAALDVLASYDASTISEINANEDIIDSLADHTSQYLVGLFPRIKSPHFNDTLNFYLKCISEFERIGDYAVNLTENATELKEKKIAFSDYAKNELAVICEALNEVMDYARAAFADDDIAAARRIEPVEEVIDNLVAAMRENHLQRLKDGTCSAIQGIIFSDILINAERISDQCSNIGIYALSEHDPEIAQNQHIYKQNLHRGTSEEYNALYSERQKYYMEKFKVSL